MKRSIFSEPISRKCSGTQWRDVIILIFVHCQCAVVQRHQCARIAEIPENRQIRKLNSYLTFILQTKNHLTQCNT